MKISCRSIGAYARHADIVQPGHKPFLTSNFADGKNIQFTIRILSRPTLSILNSDRDRSENPGSLSLDPMQTQPTRKLVSFPDPPRKAVRGSGVQHFLSHGVGPYCIKNVIIALSNPELEFLTPQSIWTTSYTAWFAKAQCSRKVYWDSQTQAARQVFTISDSFQNMIAYVMH